MAMIIKSVEYYNDLKSIGSYLEEKGIAPDKILKTIMGIEDSVAKLKDFPELGNCYEFDGYYTGFRHLIVNDFVVFYHITADGSVAIDRVFDQRMQYISQLLFNKSDYEE